MDFPDEIVPESILGKLDKEAVTLTEFLDEAYHGKFRPLTVAIIVEGWVQNDEETVNAVHYSCSDPRRWVQRALLQEAADFASELNDDRQEEVKNVLESDDDE